MTSLTNLYRYSRKVSPTLRVYMKVGVRKILSLPKSRHEIARGCMEIIWNGYDAGGHSHGRSLRAGILEKAQDFLRNGNEKRAKLLLGILIAMYHDTEYLKISWHNADIGFFHWTDSSLTDRVYLVAIAYALGIDELPDLRKWNRDKIITLLKD